MDFTFSEDQLLFRDSVRDFLVNEVTPERIRGIWESDSGRDDGLWQQLAEMGLTGITVAEEHGGLGMNELDFVLLAQECGYVALPEPLVNTALVAVPVISQLGGEVAAQWLPQIAAGETRVAVGCRENGLAEDAAQSGLLLWAEPEALYLLTPEQFSARFNESVDPSRRLYAVDIADGVAPVASGEQAAALYRAVLDRGALGAAAQALGLAQRMIDISVQYTGERQQFGKVIGSFQAVKHHMANVAVRLEYAKAPVTRAAYALAHAEPAEVAVSHAKLVACEAANLAAKNSIQVHGAMGYTWEVDLHIFMKKAWAMAGTFGDTGFHKQRVAEFIFADSVALGAGTTFG
ncbi:acyl-CoA dehydrogenase family protein [Parahaliea aestuarii]|uniref:Acyl-CoA dehydrogenase n=1 Tax=Parahaliea aestuarii TaxID=1852021 RepID=A0A5C8ZR34_9GAMM|nr:acyl-CoA dehydrogenase family protein [Parahaliea aestuarii]TXS90082.1 acyl-CoA dehydrogenase [Parahaliea aestuarii]